MKGKSGPDAVRVLDQIIAARRSIRVFTEAIPPRKQLEEVLRAGLLAPFAGAAGRTLAETRRFIVLKKGTDQMRAANELMTAQVRANSRKFSFMVKLVPYLRRNGQGFAKTLEKMSREGISAFRTAPYYIIVAERKGIPPAQKQSIAHVMQNMWLKATAMGLGFQLLSATQTMAKNRAFLNLIGLPIGAYEIDGCVVGYPAQTPAVREAVSLDEVAVWI